MTPKTVMLEEMAKANSLGLASRRVLFDRSEGQCPWCGAGMHFRDMHAHHRLLRSAGGTWALSNIVGIHGDCHNVQPKSIHQEPKRAYALGAMIRGQQLTPGQVPMFDLSTNGYYLFDDLGRRAGTPRAEALELLTAAGATTLGVI